MPAMEELVVVGQNTNVEGRASIVNGFDATTVRGVPSGRDYRDLVKLAPGVQFTQDAIRGPSAGGSGQDNVYRFDGVDVSLPMFGTLSAEPSRHDIEQVTFARGGARAVGFNRTGGILMDSTARAGTDELELELEYVTVPEQLSGTSRLRVDRPQRWIVSGSR